MYERRPGPPEDPGAPRRHLEMTDVSLVTQQRPAAGLGGPKAELPEAVLEDIDPAGGDHSMAFRTRGSPASARRLTSATPPVSSRNASSNNRSSRALGSGMRSSSSITFVVPSRSDIPPPGSAHTGPGEGLPSSRVHLLTFPSPAPGGFLSAFASRSSTPSVACALLELANEPTRNDGSPRRTTRLTTTRALEHLLQECEV
jgi:hypothetical protein